MTLDLTGIEAVVAQLTDKESSERGSERERSAKKSSERGSEREQSAKKSSERGSEREQSTKKSSERSSEKERSAKKSSERGSEREQSAKKSSERSSEKERSAKKSSEKGSERILALIRQNPQITAALLAEALAITPRAVEKQLALLQSRNRLKRTGGRRYGRWEIVPRPGRNGEK